MIDMHKTALAGGLILLSVSALPAAAAFAPAVIILGAASVGAGIFLNEDNGTTATAGQ